MTGYCHKTDLRGRALVSLKPAVRVIHPTKRCLEAFKASLPLQRPPLIDLFRSLHGELNANDVYYCDVLLFQRICPRGLMVQDMKIARYDLVFENTARWNVNVRACVGDNDDCALENDVRSKGHIARHCQMVEFKNVWWVVEACQKVVDLLEVIAEFDKGHRVEHALGIEGEFTMVESVEI